MMNPACEFMRDMHGLTETSELAALYWIRNSERDHEFLSWYRVTERNAEAERADARQRDWG